MYTILFDKIAVRAIFACLILCNFLNFKKYGRIAQHNLEIAMSGDNKLRRN